MTRKTVAACGLLSLMVAISGWNPAATAAEKGDRKNTVTAFVDTGKTAREGVVTLWMSNVNPVVGITLPFKFAPGSDSLRLDSLLVSGGRAAHLYSSRPKYEADNQTLLMTLLLRPDSTVSLDDAIPPGEGLLARLFFSAEKAFPMKEFRMAAVELPPQNKLMYVINTANSVLPEFEVVRKPAPEWPPTTKKGKTP